MRTLERLCRNFAGQQGAGFRQRLGAPVGNLRHFQIGYRYKLISDLLFDRLFLNLVIPIAECYHSSREEDTDRQQDRCSFGSGRKMARISVNRHQRPSEPKGQRAGPGQPSDCSGYSQLNRLRSL